LDPLDGPVRGGGGIKAFNICHTGCGQDIFNLGFDFFVRDSNSDLILVLIQTEKPQNPAIAFSTYFVSCDLSKAAVVREKAPATQGQTIWIEAGNTGREKDNDWKGINYGDGKE
jgi:hypothetical protein